MAIIGQSKETGLYKRIVEEGSKYREIKYADLGHKDWEPLIHGYLPEDPNNFLSKDEISRVEGIPPVIGPGSSESNIGTVIESDVKLQATARLDDTKRIAKLLTDKVPGIKWEAHMAELATIQNRMNDRRGTYGKGIDKSFTGILNILGGLQDTLNAIPETLAQVAVAGTGMHFMSWLWAKNSTYITGDKSPASSARSGEKVIVTDETIRYHQLPYSGSSEVFIEEARIPKRWDNPIMGSGSYFHGDIAVKWDNYNSYGDGERSGSKDKNGKVGSLNYTQKVRDREKEEPTVYGIEKISAENLKEAQSSEGIRKSNSKIGDFIRTENFTNASRYLGSQESEVTAKTGLGVPVLASGYDGNFYLDSENGSFNPIIVESKSFNDNSLMHRFNTTGSVFNKEPVSTIPINTGTDLGVPTKSHDKVFTWDIKNNYSSGSKYYTGSLIYVGSKRVNQTELGPEATGSWESSGRMKIIHKGAEVLTRSVDVKAEMPSMDFDGRIEMIPFWIRALTADGTVQSKAYLYFEANLDSFSDNYEGSWEGTQYVGRADKFWTYTGFDRQINFSFKMVAHSKDQLKPKYNRLNGLLGMTAPVYGPQGNQPFMQGVLAEITIGDLLDRQLGFIKSVGLKWETDYMWELDDETIIVPHVLDVSIGFTPIHQFVPKQRVGYFKFASSDSVGSVDTFIVTRKKLYSGREDNGQIKTK